MKTPSRTSIVIVLVLIVTVSVVIFQGCATESGGTTQDDKKFAFNLAIGKYAGKEEKFVEFKNEKNAKPRFDEALRTLHGSYHIHYKKDDLHGTVAASLKLSNWQRCVAPIRPPFTGVPAIAVIGPPLTAVETGFILHAAKNDTLTPPAAAG